MSTMERWRGLKALVVEAVEHGSRAVERVQKETMARPFAILEAIPSAAAPARSIHAVYDVAVTGVHAVVREVNRAASATVDVVLDVVEKAQEPVETPPRD